MSLIALTFFHVVFSQRVSESIEGLMHTSIEKDFGNFVTCKRPSVKSMALMWDSLPASCVLEDKNSWLSMATEKFQIDRSTDTRVHFIDIWDRYLALKQYSDSWLVTGEGLNDKGGSKQMLYNNADSVFFLGEMRQFNATLEVIENDRIDTEEDIDTYEFITRNIGGLLSAYYVSNSTVFREKAVKLGEKALEFYPNWYPYTKYNFATKQGKYGVIPFIQLANMAEFLMLHKITGNKKYEDIIKNTAKYLEGLAKYEMLGESFEVVEGDKLKYSGYMSANSNSAQVQRTLWNCWKLSDGNLKVYKRLYDINKESTLRLLPYTDNKENVVMIERSPKDIQYRMHLRMCAWSGILSEENRYSVNSSEILLAEKLFRTCLRVFKDLPPSDYIHLEGDKLLTKDKHFSIPGELFESLFFLYRTTGEYGMRKLGMNLLSHLKTIYKKNKGFSGTSSKMPEDFFTKTLKYLFLTQVSHTHFLNAQFTVAGHLLGLDIS